jgi:NADH-quinone oxidoreductase subunit N
VHIPDLTALLPLIVVAATALAVLVVIAIRRHHLAVMLVTVCGLAVACAALLLAAPVVPHQVAPLLILDLYGLFYLGLLLLASLAVTVLSYGYLAGREGPCEEFYLLLLLATLGALVLVISAHFIALFLGLELLSVALYALFAYLRPDVRSLEAGVKYLLLAAASSAFLLFGMALIYAELGTMEFARMVSWRAGESMVRSVCVLTGLALTLIGLGFKLAVVPFHMWTPDIYEGAPAPITAFVATVSKGAVVALLVRYLLETAAAAYEPVLLVLSLMAAASMILGNVLALLQSNVKRLLAYSSIAQLGYLLVVLVAGGPRLAEAVTYYVVAYIVTTLCAFGCVTVLSGKTVDADTFEAYRGLFWRRPGIAMVFAVALLSLAGIPLTAGFVGKLYVLAVSVESALWLLTVLVVLNSAMGLFYYLRLVIIMYAPLPQEAAVSIPHPAPSWSWAGGVVLAVLTTLLVWLGVYPAPFLDMIRMTVASIL